MPNSGPADFQLANRLTLTIEETAQVLGVSERHVRNLLPELPLVYLGSKPVIPVDGLRVWLQEHTEAGQRRVDAAVEEVLRDFEENSDNSD